jgi:hypothetical protein
MGVLAGRAFKHAVQAAVVGGIVETAFEGTRAVVNALLKRFDIKGDEANTVSND